MKIPHNLPVRAHNKSRWFMSAISSDTEFVFIDPTSVSKVVRTVADGWTLADAESFHQNLLARHY